jgi:ribulose-5-phosphate 4-epimerase/fuculose-1-phosphate aldolase
LGVVINDICKQYKIAVRELITANHILHYHKVVDAYGHISFRSPDDPEVFILSGNRAPALVCSAKDLIEYRVSDSTAVDPKAGRGFLERFIHSEIYKRFPEVHCVVHSHSEDVLPYVVATGIEMKPSFHIAGFLGMFDFDILTDSQCITVVVCIC